MSYKNKETQASTPRALSAPAVHIQPLTATQNDFLEAYRTHQIVVSVGAAGVGKTYLGVNAAVNDLASSKVYRKIVLTRSNVPTGRSLGFFPGTIEEKLAPWLAPMISELKRRVGTNVYDSWLRSGKIEYQPLETVRGRSYDSTIILVDEAQNLTVDEIKAITTRIGENSKMVLMGDISQRDIHDSGMLFFLSTVEKYNVPIPLIIFETDDIVRSDIVASLVKAFMGEADDVYAKYRPFAWRRNRDSQTETSVERTPRI